MDKPRRIEAEDCAYTIGPFEAYDADDMDAWLRDEAKKVRRVMSKMWDTMCRERWVSCDEMDAYLAHHLPEFGFTDCFCRSGLDVPQPSEEADDER